MPGRAGGSPPAFPCPAESCPQLPALAVTEDVLQSAETRLQSTEPGPEFVVSDSSFHSPMSHSGISTLQRKAFLARKGIARSVTKLPAETAGTSARFTGLLCSSERPPHGVRPASQTQESLLSAVAYYQKLNVIITVNA